MYDKLFSRRFIMAFNLLIFLKSILTPTQAKGEIPPPSPVPIAVPAELASPEPSEKFEAPLILKDGERPINEIGFQLIKHFEGLRLEAYQDHTGIWTIGYGATGKEIGPGTKWTHEQAERELHARVKEHACYVPRYVEVSLSHNQLAALTSFCYNLGPSNLKRLVDNSGLNGGKYRSCANRILLYDKAGGQKVAGLTRRRKAERELFLRPDETNLTLADLGIIEEE